MFLNLDLTSYINSRSNKSLYINFEQFNDEYFLFPLNQPYDEQFYLGLRSLKIISIL